MVCATPASPDDPLEEACRRALERVERQVVELKLLRVVIDDLAGGAGEGDHELRASADRAVRASAGLLRALASHLEGRCNGVRRFLELIGELAEAERPALADDVGGEGDASPVRWRLTSPRQRTSHNRISTDAADVAEPIKGDSPPPGLAGGDRQRRRGKSPAPKPQRRGKAEPFFFKFDGPPPDRYDRMWKLPPRERSGRQDELFAMLDPQVGASVTLPNGSRLVTLRRLTPELTKRAESGRRRLAKLAKEQRRAAPAAGGQEAKRSQQAQSAPQPRRS